MSSLSRDCRRQSAHKRAQPHTGHNHWGEQSLLRVSAGTRFLERSAEAPGKRVKKEVIKSPAVMGPLGNLRGKKKKKTMGETRSVQRTHHDAEALKSSNCTTGAYHNAPSPFSPGCISAKARQPRRRSRSNEGKGVLASGLRNSLASRLGSGSTALCTRGGEQSKTRVVEPAFALLHPRSSERRPARPCQATAACTRRGARIAGLHSSSSRETNVRGERARQRTAAAGANHRVWRAGSASTGNGQRSPRDRSKEEPTNWAVKGARNAPAPVGRVVRRKDSLFPRGAEEGARSRERGARRAAAHIRVPRAFAAACTPACHCKREARTRLLLQR